MFLKWIQSEVCSHKGLLDGTIVNHECDPQMDCDECGGSGRCVKCNGAGEERCKKCNGTGRCQQCHGEGSHRCSKCGGTGTCRRCHGTGRITCPHCHGRGFDSGRTCANCNGKGEVACPECSSIASKIGRGVFGLIADTGGTGHGSGECKKCKGTGRIVCKTCNGSGNCTNCGGSGMVTCRHCDGSGNCPTCDGTGKVTCKRCEGSGWYQTFKLYKASSIRMKSKYFSSEFMQDGLKLASGNTIYDGVYKKWKSADSISTDETLSVQRSVDNSFNNDSTFTSFRNEYETSLQSIENKRNPYSKSITLTQVDTSKVVFRLNGIDYSLLFMGNNGVVMYDELPQTLSLYKPSFFQNIKLKLSRSKRHLSYIKTAAYIFQCDGKTMEESHVFNVFLNSLNMSDVKKTALKQKLSTYNDSMPYEQFRKEVKSIFSSKKALTFAWQCMSVDKQVSIKEVELFSKLIAEYKGITDTEINDIKRFASKYSLLDDDFLVKEYLG